MFIRKKLMSKGRRIAVQLVKSERTGAKVQQSILHHVGNVAADDSATVGCLSLHSAFERSMEQRSGCAGLAVGKTLATNTPG